MNNKDILEQKKSPLVPFKCLPVIISDLSINENEVIKWEQYLKQFPQIILASEGKPEKTVALHSLWNKVFTDCGWSNDKLQGIRWVSIFSEQFPDLTDDLRLSFYIDSICYDYIRSQQCKYKEDKYTHFQWSCVPHTFVSEATYLLEIAQKQYENGVWNLLFRSGLYNFPKCAVAYNYGYQFLTFEELCLTKKDDYADQI